MRRVLVVAVLALLVGVQAGVGLMGYWQATPVVEGPVTHGVVVETPTPAPTNSAVVPMPPTATRIRLQAASGAQPAAVGTAPAGVPLPGEALALVTLGDSLTEGQGDNLNLGGYPGRLLPLLRRVHPNFTLRNLGRVGSSSTDLIKGVDGEPSQLAQAIETQPAIVCLWVGGEDLWDIYTQGTPTTEEEAANAERFAENLAHILEQLQGTGAVVFVGTLDDQSQRPVSSDSTLREARFPGISAEEVGRMGVQVQRYNQIIVEKAGLYGAVVVDFSQLNLFRASATLDFDGLHPNSTGYAMITDIWFQSITATVE